MKGINENLEIEKETLSAQLEELSAEPAAEPISTTKFSDKKESVELSKDEYRKLSRKEKYWYNIKKLQNN